MSCDSSIGVLAVVPDNWNGITYGRHQVLSRLANRFNQGTDAHRRAPRQHRHLTLDHIKGKLFCASHQRPNLPLENRYFFNAIEALNLQYRVLALATDGCLL